jgi:hypothetical protein
MTVLELLIPPAMAFAQLRISNLAPLSSGTAA